MNKDQIKPLISAMDLQNFSTEQLIEVQKELDRLIDERKDLDTKENIDANIVPGTLFYKDKITGKLGFIKDCVLILQVYKDYVLYLEYELLIKANYFDIKLIDIYKYNLTNKHTIYQNEQGDINDHIKQCDITTFRLALVAKGYTFRGIFNQTQNEGLLESCLHTLDDLQNSVKSLKKLIAMMQSLLD